MRSAVLELQVFLAMRLEEDGHDVCPVTGEKQHIFGITQQIRNTLKVEDYYTH